MLVSEDYNYEALRHTTSMYISRPSMYQGLILVLVCLKASYCLEEYVLMIINLKGLLIS